MALRLVGARAGTERSPRIAGEHESENRIAHRPLPPGLVIPYHRDSSFYPNIHARAKRKATIPANWSRKVVNSFSCVGGIR